jgi:sugar O-acyltransferase (sialic acid O-acetyltransferase NeuD family)
MKKIVIFGTGHHSKVIIDIVEKSKQYSILGLIDNNLPKGSIVDGYEVLGNDLSINELYHEIYGGVVAIGDNFVRSKVVSKVLNIHSDFRFISAIHPSAIIGSDVTIGNGTVVMGGAVINSNSVIAEHCVINTKSSIDHGGNIGEFVSIAPGVTIGGNVTIDEFSFISLGANVIHSKVIGKHTVIGAGSTVVSDIGSYVVAFGSPARIIREREIGEKFL